MFTIYSLIIVGAFGVFALVDALAPARSFPASKWWKARGVFSAFMYVALASYSPYLWAAWLPRLQLVDASAWPLAVQFVAGYLALQLCGYLWHRALHRFDVLWRYLHQMHHSAERLDIYGALYFSPLDVVGFTFAGSFGLVVLLGVAPFAAALIGVTALIVSLFTHANLRTPRWLGYIIARPEYHALHHERGRHTGNFAELTLWDMVFGTFRNPRDFEGQVGFYEGASLRIPDMLLGRRVEVPRSEQTTQRLVPWTSIQAASAEERANEAHAAESINFLLTAAVCVLTFLGWGLAVADWLQV